LRVIYIILQSVYFPLSW